MPYTSLLMDLDETLLDFSHDIREAFFSMCRKQQIPADAELFDSYNAINHSWWDKFEKGLCTKPELFLGRFEEWTGKHHLQADPAVLAEAIFPELSEQARLLPGAYELTQALAKRYDLYFATNGNAWSQHSRIEISGLNRLCKGVFVSEDAGAAKPDPRYFTYVFEHMAVPKDRCLLIGDSLTSDIAGACGYGLDCIWYNPRRMPNHTAFTPTYEVSDYAGIAALLLPGTDSNT